MGLPLAAAPSQMRMLDYPGERPAREIWQMTAQPLRNLEDGEVAVRVETVSVDPGMQGWITNKRSYMPPVEPGGVMRAFGIGEVIASRSHRLPEGT